jgi:hypothetical protein
MAEMHLIYYQKRAPLVTIRFRERAAAWWQNYKYCRYLDNLPSLIDWDELKREMN